jgi:hypothetical protein
MVDANRMKHLACLFELFERSDEVSFGLKLLGCPDGEIALEIDIGRIELRRSRWRGGLPGCGQKQGKPTQQGGKPNARAMCGPIRHGQAN